jgi:hypothetical protein
MSRRSSSDGSERPGRAAVGSLAAILILASLVISVACANPSPSGTDPTSPGVPASVVASAGEPSSDTTVDAQPGDLDGLVVLTGGLLSIGAPGGTLVPLDGSPGQVTGLSAINGLLLVQTAGPMFALAEIDHQDMSAPAWHVVTLPALDGRKQLSTPVLSPGGDKAAVTAAGRANTVDVVVLDLAGGEPTVASLDREPNGPPVWIDDSSLLLEVLPIAGRSRFVRLSVATGRVDPVAGDGFGPAISGDGSTLAVASTDGSVVAVPAAGWLAGSPPDEGSLADASGTAFELAVDAAGRRIAIGYADEAGDPASVAVVVHADGAWRRHVVPMRFAAGAPTTLGWIN